MLIVSDSDSDSASDIVEFTGRIQIASIFPLTAKNNQNQEVR